VGLGALVIPPREPFDGFSRVVAAAWLHAGSLHLIMNVLGLVAIGRRVEAVMGPVRFTMLFLGSAVLGNLVARELLSGPMFLVGASGGVMGLLGALLAIVLRRHRAAPTRYLRRVRQEILLVIGTQAVFDWSVPNVSHTVHMAGLAAGLLLGLLMSGNAPKAIASARTTPLRQPLGGDPQPSGDR
jgi:rhomboid protease GluP